MIKINNLSKRYGTKEAVKGISFEIQRGEIVGFLGPNGAGKSTTMNILTGYLSASGGSASIAGFDVLDDALDARRHVGYLPEQPPLYMDMTVDEYLGFVYELKKAKQPRTKHLREICEKVGLSDVRGRIIKNLSKGYKQRVGIAQALIGDPDVLILDEPTVGLDPNQMVDIRSLIRSLGTDHTVILSTHIITEVVAVCQRVIIISDGEIVADDSLSALMERSREAEGKFVAEIDGEPDSIISILAAIDGVSDVTAEGNKYTLTADSGVDIRKAVLLAAGNHNLELLTFTAVDVSLEAIFASLTKKGGN